jgi:hypothetical protein
MRRLKAFRKLAVVIAIVFLSLPACNKDDGRK